MKKIMIIDDDEKLTGLLQEFLEQYKFKPIIYHNPIKAITMINKKKPDLIILDIMMPDMDGFQTLREIRENHLVPVIMLTARGEVSDRIVGLELGADDYLSKPFEPKELILRITNILNKTKIEDLKRIIEFGSIKIDLNKLFIYRNQQSLKINNTEKIILEKMINSPGKIFKREEIGNLIDLDKERSIDVIITRLRRKIEENPKSPKFLQTIRGEGYVLWIE